MKRNTFKTILQMLLLMIAIGTIASIGGFADNETPSPTFKDALLAIVVIVVTLAFIYVAFMMVFKEAEWSDVAHIYGVAMLIAVVSVLATLLFP